MVRTTALRLALAAACGAGLVTAVAGPAIAGPAADPPGNNGTVKVDQEPFDDHPGNEPHVDCLFQIDFYGFDEGDLSATVLFEAVPPTVSDDATPPGGGEELLTDEVDIGEDAAGGGTDLDASETYDLSDVLSAVPHAQQGWHVRLTVEAEGSIGADTKHKVFWVSGCGPTTTTTTKPGSTTSTTGGTTTTTKPGSTTTTTGGTTTSQPGDHGPTSSSPGGPSTTVASSQGGGGLPITGSSTLPLLLGATVLLGLGAGGVGLARLLRHTAADQS